ncbi:hypothetical protein L2X98_18790 [Microbacterium elymi]|uniref:Uncharacterized protein n=1 Tax=Microbacterium elymi TaxID=2909587 RepID=A0ABY5NJU1_9MICO|nr:hypothetical protein [Microbacterium elymi]UUT35437.1 hypothetical protein L2X98_18790 [Microbacterium elymi]
MERLRDDDGIHALIGQGDGLSGAEECLDLRQLAPQDRQHLFGRIDGDDAGRAREERRGELAGAGPEVEHGRDRFREQDIDGGLREARSIPVVVLAGALERCGEGGGVHVRMLPAGC